MPAARIAPCVYPQIGAPAGVKQIAWDPSGAGWSRFSRSSADDELEIMCLLARLAQAVDDRDADAYRDCLADEVVCLVSDASPNEVWRAVPREAYGRRAVGAGAAVV